VARSSPGARSRISQAANGLAWLVLFVLSGAGLWIASRFGWIGLMLLGGATWLVCSRAALDEDVPTWSPAVLRAAMERQRGQGAAPEERAARRAERRTLSSAWRFYGRCGMVLMAVGAAGFIWQR